MKQLELRLFQFVTKAALLIQRLNIPLLFRFIELDHIRQQAIQGYHHQQHGITRVLYQNGSADDQ
ncbi:hypothetical protein D3C73_1543840 [compost metagenome]